MATLSLTYTISASDQARIVATYQVAANADLNATANASQVLAYIQNKVVKPMIINQVKTYENSVAVAAIVPAIDPALT